MDVKEKIQQYVDCKGININKFEISIGMSKSYWRKTKSISANVVSDICRIYSDLSPDWLLTGKGDMIKNDMIVAEHYASYGTNEWNIKEKEYLEKIEALKTELNMLKGENRVLREQMGLGERKKSEKSA